MIAKITRGADPGRIGAYLHGPGRAEEHVHDHRLGGAVIAGTIPVLDARAPDEWVAEMRAAIGRRGDITRPVWQASLRAAPTDRVMTDAEWAIATQGFAGRMRFDAHPWVGVRHGADHVHLVVSRVDHDGAVWHGRFDRRQAQEACAQLEVDHALTRAPRSREVTVTPGARNVPRRQADGQLTQGEWQRAVATRTNPTRMVLADRVHTAVTLAAGRGRGAFEDELRRLGVAHRANEAATGRMNGYRFADPAHRDPDGVAVWFKGSQLDKSLSWAALSRRLEDPPLSVEQQPAHRRLQTRTGRARDLTAANDTARAARGRLADAARADTHRSLGVTTTRWDRAWDQRGQGDRDQAAVARLRRQLHITPRVGDVVVSGEELAATAERRYIERILNRPNPRYTRAAETTDDLHRARSYTPPTPSRDHDFGL